MAKKVSVGVQIDGTAKGFKSAAADASKASQKLKKRLNKDSKGMIGALKNVAAAIGITFALNKVVDFGKEIIRLGGQVGGVEKAFNKLNNPALLKDLRKATRGTVEDLKLMQYAVKADNFNIPLSKLATYFEFATNRAIETGQSVDYLVNSIIDGVGKKSTMILDNLGISLVDIQAETKKTGDFMSATGNIFERELKNMGEVADTAAIRIGRLNTAWTNFKTNLGQRVVESDFFNNLLGGIEAVAEALAPKENPYKDFTRQQITAERLKLQKQREQLLFGNEAINQTMSAEGKPKISPLSMLAASRTGGAGIAPMQKSNYAQDLANNLKNLEENLSSLADLDAWDKYLTALEKAQKLEELNAAQAKAAADALKAKEEQIAATHKRLEDYNDELRAKKKTPPSFAGQGIGDYGMRLVKFGHTGDPGLQDTGAEGLEWVDSLESAFQSFFASTDEGFKGMAKAFGHTLKMMAAELAAKAAIFGILTIISGGSTKAALSAANMLKDFKFFDQGGVVSGPTMGMIGEYPGARSNPEVVAPLNKLKNLITPNAGGGNLEGIIHGRDLKLVMRRND